MPQEGKSPVVGVSQPNTKCSQVTLAQAMPVLRRLQARGVPLILAKDVYQGFTLAEYKEIMEGLSPRGLSVHLKAESVEEGRAVMEVVRTRAQQKGQR